MFAPGVEILGPQNRAIVAVLTFSFGSLGGALVGLLAWWIRDWRWFLRIVNVPAYIAIAFIWLMPESFRWLLAKGKYSEVAKSLLTAAKLNGITLSESMSSVLHNKPENILLDEINNNNTNEALKEHKFSEIFQCPSFCLRIIACAYCWLSTLFVFYGLSLTAVVIGGNKFSDFVLVSSMELFGSIFIYFMAERVRRKRLLIPSLFISGISLLVSSFLPDIYWLNLTLNLVGKFSITVAFSTLYTFTSEIFPTYLRHTLLGFCSGIGRLGSLIATQSPALTKIYNTLPTLLFGGTAIVAGILCFSFPETFQIKLPDTIEEAMNPNVEKEKSKIKF